MRDSRSEEALIIGANGLVGRRVGKSLLDKGIKWIGTSNKRHQENSLSLDITDSVAMADLFARICPKAVFHCANLAGGVDFCEKNPEAARKFHLEATKEMAKHCENSASVLIFISTDYVFDGTDGPYKEETAVNPLNLYGRLKLDAERWIQDNMKRYLIIRTTNIYGWDPETLTPNYIMSLYRSVKEGKTFNAPSFLWGNPTYVGDLAEAIAELYIKEARGIFHIVGSSFVNRLEWAMKACEILGLDGSVVSEIKKPPENMTARPLKSWLSSEKFRNSYATLLRDLYDGLRQVKSDMKTF
ncbi:MAG: SDR family oxidoreductase [Candidatus Omnitrophota bacterium]